MMIYRLVVGENPTINLKRESQLPIGESPTGFWQTDPKKTVALGKAHEAHIASVFGGLFWEEDADVLIASFEDCEFVDDFSQYKTDNQPEYDDGEVFVTSVSSYDRISWEQWKKR